MLDELLQQLQSTSTFSKFENELRQLTSTNPITISGIRGSLLSLFTASLHQQYRGVVLVVTSEKDRAEEIYDDCTRILDDSSVRLYVAPPNHKSYQLDITALIAKIESLLALSQSSNILLIASAEALTARLPSPEQFTSHIIKISAQHEYPFQDLLSQLNDFGFEKKDFVEEYGDYAVRGGIVDVFPFIGEHPIRLEFWGDTIESIREFDVVSQRSIRELSAAVFVPDISNLTDERGNQPTSIFDYLPSNTLLFIDGPVLCQKEVEELQLEGYASTFSWEALEESISQRPRILHTSFEQGSNGSIQFGSSQHPPIQGSIRRLIEQIRHYNEQQYNVLILADSNDEAQRLEELIEEEVTNPSYNEDSQRLNGSAQLQYKIHSEALHHGFIFPDVRLAIFTEHEIFGRRKQRKLSSRKRFHGISQKELVQLRRGDFVVHQDYGIGKFAGLQKLRINGVETEVMKLLYDGRDTLYVNLNSLNRVQKYSSQEGHVPKLSKLGTPDWNRLKAHARKKIKDIARDLILLYAKRKHESGFACAPDAHWQKELEASFIYEDTPDQARTTEEVKRDMENPSPMDRLICGDVGFGKTEIAVRAAFKAVMNNKQVAVLVPTTILAQQHYQTFRERVERYSVRVEMINRFRTRKEQNAILEALKAGSIDILIGTHRLLSKDVQFKDLGLLIIDEEHRFGVAAKEKLRQMRATVDTLTLTATPIPRTLQFSLLGARDLSLITTPPKNRLPIQTEIAEFDTNLIREAILKELHRGGQVYFVHDRVQNIENVQQMLQALVPTARYRIAHGQMKGHELEHTMLDFFDKKFDVLICTKIIESGIDIPSVNTIIINRADRFGLAELYQLRGRVGRSNVQAYAYLLTPPFSVLPHQTLRKLQALEEFTELGSGFNLAMRDLEIRGAGNLLGSEQSGFIMEMGFEMYQRIVDEAVQELKEKEFSDLFPEQRTVAKKNLPETVIEVDVDAYIPEIYIEHDSERLDVYRRLYRVSTNGELQNLRAELRDRFGEYPEEVEHLFKVVEIRKSAAVLGFIKVELQGDTVTLHFPPSDVTTFYEGEAAPFQQLMKKIPELKSYRCTLKQNGKQLYLVTHIPHRTSPSERLEEMESFLATLKEGIVI